MITREGSIDLFARIEGERAGGGRAERLEALRGMKTLEFCF